mmetsp:Transcript_30858/g.106684  ORF Transcript_30858/g.106684 Transcript_30858/m.106684 type:complete len:501 (-) Transcript_30858:484-1986(-)
MRAEPHRGADDALDLLAAREVLHLAVGAKLLLEAKVVQVGLDARRRQRLDVAGLGGDAVVDGLHELEEAVHLEDDVGHIQVLLVVHGRAIRVGPLDLVFVIAVARAAAHEHLDAAHAAHGDVAPGRLLARLERLHLVEDDLALARGVARLVQLRRQLLEVDDEGLLQLGLLLVGHLCSLHGLLLLVQAAREAPLDVVDGRHLQVLLNVVEGVLRHVGDAAILVAVDLGAARVGLGLADEALDQRRLAGAVGADARDARRLRALHGDVDERGLIAARVREREVLGLDDGLGLGLDALERARHGEGKLHLRVVDGEVGLGHGALLHKGVEVARVALEAHVLVVDDVGEHLVQELGVVRDDNRRHVLTRRAREEIDQPGLLLHVEVVRRLVEEEQVGVEEHGARQRELHLPAAAEVADGLHDELLGELHLQELLEDLVAAERRQDGLLQAKVERRRRGVRAVNVVVHEAGAELHQLLGAGEARERARRDGAHERRLAAAVVAE